MLSEAELQQAVQREIARYGTLDLAIAALWNDACGASWGAPVHDIYRAALAERGERRHATESTDERCFRLGFAAVAHDKHAEDLRAEAAQDRHLAKARRALWGALDEPAKRIEQRAVIGEELAAEAEAEAKRLRDQCTALRRAQEVVNVVLEAAE